MSVYTNDVDTLRQMLSQSIPQLVSSAITIVSVFASMCMLSWQLTIVTMLMVALMLFCSKKITQQSGKFFIAQQRDLGKVNGYIEEMMEGQKVVKVFTHEQKALEGFRELNDKLKDSAKQANSFANIMMPVNMLGGQVIRLGAGIGVVNTLDPGDLHYALQRLEGKARKDLTDYYNDTREIGRASCRERV